MPRWSQWLLPAVIAISIPLLVGLSGCREGDGNSLFGIGQKSEIQIGRQASADLERQYGVVNNPSQLARIRRIGSSIAAVSQRRNLPWSFKILNMSDVNAMALPGGFVYVTRGLLATNLTDSELAGVMAHEIAHVNQRHTVKAIQRAMTYELLAGLLFGGSSAAIQTAAGLAIQYALELPHSRSDEYEADAIGIRLAYNAGYPADGLVQFLRVLQSMTGRQRTPEWLQTHPLTSARIARAQQIANQISGKPRPVPLALSTEDQKILKQIKDQEKKR
ncbi:MAG TPA: M48 family metallopeptidase [Armatimonadota bacterium]|nr:M48 family metallopeptidase [Armatimonadota bacterium]